MAIYGCWKGHTTKRSNVDLDKMPRLVICDQCGEAANLFDVMNEPLRLTVIKGGQDGSD